LPAVVVIFAEVIVPLALSAELYGYENATLWTNEGAAPLVVAIPTTEETAVDTPVPRDDDKP
jgi:hypothetical protein